MSWHYQVRKRVINGDAFFDMIEMFDGPMGWTKDSIAPCGDTKEELLADLRRMLADAETHPIFEEPS